MGLEKQYLAQPPFANLEKAEESFALPDSEQMLAES